MTPTTGYPASKRNWSEGTAKVGVPINTIRRSRLIIALKVINRFGIGDGRSGQLGFLLPTDDRLWSSFSNQTYESENQKQF